MLNRGWIWGGKQSVNMAQTPKSSGQHGCQRQYPGVQGGSSVLACVRPHLLHPDRLSILTADVCPPEQFLLSTPTSTVFTGAGEEREGCWGAVWGGGGVEEALCMPR